MGWDNEEEQNSRLGFENGIPLLDLRQIKIGRVTSFGTFGQKYKSIP